MSESVESVEAAEGALVAAKRARGTAKSGAKYDAYREASENLARIRREFREQEEQAGNRAGFVSGDAAN